MSHRKQKSSGKKSSNNFCGSDIIEHKSTLTEEFFQELLDLEQQFSTQQYTLAQVNSAIERYAKCVEYFDSINDPVKVYFMEKIQTTLVNQQTLKKLLNCQETYIEQYDEQQEQQFNTQESFLTTTQQFTNNSFLETLTTEQDDQFFEEATERKGLQKMQEEMKKRRLEASKNVNDPQNIKKQKIIRQRQMQMLMEVEKEYKNVENQSMIGGPHEQKNNEIKNTATLIQETESADQKQQELFTEEMDKQETDIQERIKQRKKLREQMKKKKQQKQEDIKVFVSCSDNLEDSAHKKNKGSIDLTEDQQNNNNNNSEVQSTSSKNRSRQSSKATTNNNNNNNSNTDEKKIHVSDIFLDEQVEIEKNRTRLKSQQQQQLQELLNNNVGQEPIKEQNQEDEEDIEEHLQNFKKQIKQQYLKLPEDVKVKLRTASEMQDLDYRVLKSMHKCINDYEKKQKMSKSMTGPEITSMLAKNRNFQKKIKEGESASNQNLQEDQIDEDNQGQYLIDGSTFSHSPFRNDKKSRRNLSCQLTSEFSNSNNQGGLDNFAKNINNNVEKTLEKVDIKQSE